MSKISISNIYIIEDAIKSISTLLKSETEYDIEDITKKISAEFWDVPRVDNVCCELKRLNQDFYNLRNETITLVEDINTFVQNTDIIPVDGM